MRPRTQIMTPDLKSTQFQNFDRLAKILFKAKPVERKKPVKAVKANSKLKN